MCFVRPMDDSSWDALVKESPQGTVFSTTAWMKMLGPYQCHGVYEHDNLLGGIGGFASPLPLTPFQGILITPYGGKHVNLMGLHRKVAESVIDVAPQSFFCHYAFPDVRPFHWAGYASSVRYTYVVALSDIERTWDEMDRDTRNLVRAHEDTPEPMGWQDFDAMYAETFSRKNLKRPVESDIVRQVIAMGECWAVPGAAAVVIRDNKRAYYILGASTESDRSCALLWHIFEMLSKQGVKEIDLVGCNSRSIALFKKGFGGKLAPYYGVSR